MLQTKQSILVRKSFKLVLPTTYTNVYTAVDPEMAKSSYYEDHPEATVFVPGLLLNIVKLAHAENMLPYNSDLTFDLKLIRIINDEEAIALTRHRGELVVDVDRLPHKKLIHNLLEYKQNIYSNLRISSTMQFCEVMSYGKRLDGYPPGPPGGHITIFDGGSPG